MTDLRDRLKTFARAGSAPINDACAQALDEIDRLLSTLKWALPIAEHGLENARQERLRCGHTFGTKRVGLHDFEFHAMEDAKAALTSGQHDESPRS